MGNMAAEQLECISQDSRAKQREAGSAALCRGYLPARAAGVLATPGRPYWSGSAPRDLTTITLTASLLLCFGGNPPLRQSLYLCVFKVLIPSVR